MAQNCIHGGAKKITEVIRLFNRMWGDIAVTELTKAVREMWNTGLYLWRYEQHLV
jgi:hypothetical protein